MQNNNFNGAGSLHQAVADACDGATITFASDMVITIVYTNGQADIFDIKKGLTIDGGNHDIVIQSDLSGFPWLPYTGIFLVNSPNRPVIFRNLTISQAPGGAIEGFNTDVTIIGSTFTNNSSAEGGFLNSNGGRLTIVDSRVVNNNGQFGSAIAASDTTIHMTNTLIAHNVITGGAGIDVFNSIITATHSTIVSNGSLGSGGDGNIRNLTSDPGQVYLRHSIVAGGLEDGVLGQRDCKEAVDQIVDLGYNLLGETCLLSTTTSSHIVSNQVFAEVLGPLGDYGDGQLSYPLALGSAAIDGGLSGSCLVDRDQRGIGRPQGAACDIGAFESQGFGLATNGDNQLALSNTAFGTPLQLTISSGDGSALTSGHVVSFTAPVAGASVTTATFTATTNASGQVSVPVIANGQAGSYVVTATVIGFDPIAFNLTNAMPEADVWVEKTVVSDIYVPDEPITYTIHFGNQGLDTATNVVLTDLIPNQLTGLSYQTALASGVNLTLNGGQTYVWNVSDLSSGQSGIITVTGTLNDKQTVIFTNTATIATATTDGDPSNNQADIALTVPNFAPVLVDIEAQSLVESEGMTVTLVVTDSNDDSVWYSLLDAPAGMTVSPAGLITWQTTESESSAFYIVTVIASDGVLTDSKELYVSVDSVNEAPAILSAGTDQTVEEGDTVAFTVVASDNDLPVQILRYSIDNLPSGATFSNGGVFHWDTAEADGPGVYPLIIQVSDDLITSSQIVVITVTEDNEGPSLGVLNNVTVNEGQTINFTAIATDTDTPAQTLTFSLDTVPNGANFGTDGVFSWNTGEANDGIYPLIVTVSDGFTSTSESLVVTVGEINEAPVLGALSNQTINEGETVGFVATATDNDLPAQPLIFSQIGLGSAVISDTAGVFTWHSDDSHGGTTYPVTIIVSDGALTDSQTINITVNEVNEAPVLPTGLNTHVIEEGRLLTLNATATDIDLPAQTLSYSLNNEPSGMSIDSEGIIRWQTTEADGPATHNITVNVSDSAVTTSRVITVIVTEKNEEPIVNRLSDQTVNEGDAVSFTISATDADLPTQTIGYELDTNIPISATISHAGVFNWPTNESHGGDVFELTVYVGDGVVTRTQTVAITVTEVNETPNLAPIPAQTVPQNGRVSFTAIVTDTDQPAQSLTYSLINAPAEATIGQVSGDFSWQTTITDTPGLYQATILVSDGVVTVSQIVDITISSDNDAPVIVAPSDQQVVQTNGLTFTVEATDDPAQFLDFSIMGAPPAAIFNDEGDFIWQTAITDTPGIYTATVFASDGLLTTTQIITITVLENIEPDAAITLTVVKVITNDLVTQEAFSFAINGPLSQTFILTSNTTTDRVRWTGLSHGNYIIQEIGAPAYSLETVHCVDDQGQTDVTDLILNLNTATRQVTLTFTETLAVTCTFFNTLLGQHHEIYLPLISRKDSDINTDVNSHKAIIYLPLLTNNTVSGPDLIIEALLATRDHVTVTIRNQGTQATMDDFWVDVYFNPNQIPTLNQPWQKIAEAGAHWGVTTRLAPNERLTLIIDGPYFVNKSQGAFPISSQVYGYVDSININTTYGNILEGNEENNLSQPISSLP
ncbi:MAG: choice-of-anchor Q domain-containing protein [Chloroflexota bacterium]